MAIKAIINNTEKEIEQIKNSDEQDIDYVYSRIGDTEVEGESPISIKSIGGELTDYHIYGNTVGGAGVGDLVESGEHAGEYKVPVTVEGKNLLQNTATSQTINGVTFTVNADGSVVCSGTATQTVIYMLNDTFSLEPGTYNLTGCPAGGGYTDKYKLDIVAPPITYGTDVGNGSSFTLSSTLTNAMYRIIIYAGQTCNNLTFYPMIRKADIEDDTYEPYHAPVTTSIYLPEQIRKVGDEAEYIDYAEQKMHRVRKNLLPNTATSQTINGVTFTVNDDGSVTCNGTARGGTASLIIPDVTLPTGHYIVKGCPAGGDENTTYKILIYVNNVWRLNDKGSSGNFILTETAEVSVRIAIYSGYTCDNLTFYPMIRNADISDDTYEPYIENTDLDVILPALSTIKGTNILSVNTSIQPSNIYIKDNFDYKRIFTATRAIKDELPLNYKSIEDNDSTLKNYRIYGNTVEGESVGDKTDNIIRDYAVVRTRAQYAVVLSIDTELIPNTTYSFTCLLNSSELRLYINENLFNTISYVKDDVVLKVIVKTLSELPDSQKINEKWIMLKNSITEPVVPELSNIMMIKGSEMPAIYEPYGYRVPVTVSNGTDTLTTPIYLPEQIKKVGDEAEYIDYGEQKQHRVRKNLLQNTATSRTINGVTFTANSDGSVTCNGTANNTILYEIHRFPRFSGKCILSGCPINGSQNTYRLQYTNMSNMAYQEYGTGVDIYQFDETQYPTSRINIRIENGYTCDDLTFYPMIRKADITDDTYEPYIENTDVDVTLPALPTLPGTNTLTVGTEVQPSDIYLKGKIKKKPKIYYKIYYYSQDGQTALSTETVEEGHDCTYSTVPTKESDTDFDYIFTGWSTSTNQSSPTSGATTNIQQDTNLYAAFSKSFKTDTISDSWKDIITACNNGTYSGKYQVGDLKTIDVGTEGPVQMQIVAIDTDLLASDNTKKAPITWISKQLLNTYKAMHSTSSNYLSDWANCDMRTYLRGTILPMLPSVVQNGIKEVTKYTCKRTSSTTYTTVSTTENIWLPSYREVSYYTTDCETSGVQYNSIFTNDYASQRIKLKVGEAEDDAYYWWTRSASGDSLSVHQYYFALVGRGGYTNYIGWDCTSFGGVAIGFCT